MISLRPLEIRLRSGLQSTGGESLLYMIVVVVGVLPGKVKVNGFGRTPLTNEPPLEKL